jgi:hypothetical protein
VLAKTNLERRPLKLVYDANRDGWKAKIFHEKVDKLGPAIVLARSQSGGIFGGYNPTGWVNYGELRGSIAAFLYTFPDGNTNDRPIKLQKISGAVCPQIRMHAYIHIRIWVHIVAFILYTYVAKYIHLCIYGRVWRR